MSATRSVRVLVVDGDPLTREGIVACIGRWKGLQVCGLAKTAAEARQQCATLRPDLIVLDLPLSGAGYGLVREFSRLHRAAITVVVAVHDDRESVERALRAGAQGYVRRSDEPDELRAACAAVLRGERYVSHSVTQSVLGGMAKLPRKQGSPDETHLSERERGIFDLIGRGQGTTAIARELKLSVKTVETHQRRIKEKLGLGSTMEVRQRAQHWLATQDASLHLPR